MDLQQRQALPKPPVQLLRVACQLARPPPRFRRLPVAGSPGLGQSLPCPRKAPERRFQTTEVRFFVSGSASR
jgi:hypothetical protein